MDISQEMTKAFLPHVMKVRVNEDKAVLVILSDIHQGANCRKYLQESVEFLQSLGPKCKVLIGGDSTNTTTKNSKGNVLEEWGHGDEQIFTLVDDLKPLQESGQLIGIIAGNHPRRVYDETFITIEMMIASLLGDRSLYKGDQGIVYFNVNKNLYIYNVLHKHRRTEGYYDYFQADVTVMEHDHKPMAKPKIIVEHNKFSKTPVVKQAWEVYQSSFQFYPEYAQAQGYRPQFPGFFMMEMGGDTHDRYVTPFLDSTYRKMIENGYTL